MTKRLTLLLISLLLLTALGEAFHFHADGVDHPECSICAAAHQQADAGFTPAPAVIRRPCTDTAYVRPVLTAAAKTFHNPANDRAPPA
jgi:hypothetical protein